nr:helix-turn-helix transcriptional regulator [Eubacteriales bacterium]
MEPIITGNGKSDREGRILRDRRIELGMTQEEAALELGISLQQYQRYEYGDRRLANCPMRIGLRICALLELDPFEVIGIE